MPAGGGDARQITSFDGGDTWSPAWSPDGRHLAFGHADGPAHVWTISADGSGARPLLGTTCERDNHIVWTSANQIVYQVTGDQELRLLDPVNGTERTLFTARPGWVYDLRPSPDGQLLAVWVRGTSEFGTRLISLQDGSSRGLASGFVPVGWAADGLHVYALLGDRMDALDELYLVPMSGEQPRLHLTIPFSVKPWEMSIAGDGRSVVAAAVTQRSDAWIVEDFDPQLDGRSR